MIDRIQAWVKYSPMFKFVAILFITLLLLIPGSQVDSLISERKQLKGEVVAEISDKWGNKQSLAGPFLTIPYFEVENVGLANEKRVKKLIHLLPDELKIEGEVHPEVRKRSIYKVILYQADIELSGTFSFSSLNDLPIDSNSIAWDQATWSLSISDPRGVSEVSSLKWDSESIELEPGLSEGFSTKHGLQCPIKLTDINKPIRFNTRIKCRGSSTLHVAPLGKTTVMELHSSWPDPSFTGAFLPENHEITSSGFTANWKILNINRSFNQVWVDRIHSLDEWMFGFDLVENVDVYQKTHRASKYAFLIIVITFTFFFFFEILRKLNIHPIQYIIVGFAILVFYILLLALSEQMAFGWSFLLSASSTISLVTYYFYHISKSYRVASLFAMLFTFLYGFIYIILNAEAYSLLIGSIGLFLLIATITHFTRNIDWYKASTGDVMDATDYDAKNS